MRFEGGPHTAELVVRGIEQEEADQVYITDFGLRIKPPCRVSQEFIDDMVVDGTEVSEYFSSATATIFNISVSGDIQRGLDLTHDERTARASKFAASVINRLNEASNWDKF